MKANKDIKYILYARKSSESDERQTASIDAQVRELKELAQQEGLEVVEVLSEAKSAKNPGREVFNELLERIKQGEAEGILTWKFNRLARNPVDGGEVQWMLQRGVIKKIKTNFKEYHPEDNSILTSVEFGQATQFSRDLGKDASRGMREKAEKGWFPGSAPTGYKNIEVEEKDYPIIAKDEEKFDLVKKIFKTILQGERPADVLKKARDEWDVKGKEGKPISRSTFYKILNNPFYSGEFEFPLGTGNWFEGKHEPMITKSDFQKIQDRLGTKAGDRAKKLSFPYSGMLKCGECKGGISPDRKKQVRCTECSKKFSCLNRNTCTDCETKIENMVDVDIKRYVYYACKNSDCPQGSIREKELENEIEDELSQIELHPKFKEWAFKQIKKMNKEEVKSRKQILKNQRKQLDQVREKIDNLIDMRASNEIGPDRFKNKKREAEKEKERLEELLEDTNQRADEWADKAEQALSFAETAKERFNDGSIEKRKEIAFTLGSNYLLKDKEVLIQLQNPFPIFKKISKEVESIHQNFELEDSSLNKEKVEGAYEENPRLLGSLDSNQDF
ncbi:MAG: recombinase family protein [Candidatus Paceibacteria bacterium]